MTVAAKLGGFALGLLAVFAAAAFAGAPPTPPLPDRRHRSRT